MNFSSKIICDQVRTLLLFCGQQIVHKVESILRDPPGRDAFLITPCILQISVISQFITTLEHECLALHVRVASKRQIPVDIYDTLAPPLCKTRQSLCSLQSAKYAEKPLSFGQTQKTEREHNCDSDTDIDGHTDSQGPEPTNRDIMRLRVIS